MNDSLADDTLAAAPRTGRIRPRSPWLAPTGLILLSVIPMLAGAARLTELGGPAASTAENARFLDSPAPVVTHIVSVTIFTLLGAFQVVPALQRGRRAWHRLAGRVLVPAGLVAALSGIWMVLFYPHPPGDGLLVSAIRLVFGTAMAASICLGIRAIARRDFAGHGRWMTRAYAIGVAAGTQALLLIPGALLYGPNDKLSRAVLMGSAWLLNLAVAEWVIRRRSRCRPKAGPPRPPTAAG